MHVETISLANGEVPSQSDFEEVNNFSSILIQVFAATVCHEHLQNVLNRIASLLPQAVVIGTSSDEAIDNKTICSNDHIVLAITGFNNTTLHIAFDAEPKDSKSTALSLARRVVKPDTQLIISFCEADSINGELYLEGIAEVNKELIVAGGIAATPTFTDTFIIAGTNILSQGSVMVGLCSNNLQVHEDNSFGWQPVGQEFIVTKARDNLVESISEQSPLSLFKHYLGNNVADALPGVGSAFPLMIQRDEMLVARGIIGLDGESFIVSGNVKEGDSVYIGYGNPATIIDQNKLASKVVDTINTPDVIFSYYCVGRKMFLPRNIVEYEIASLSHLAPTIGFFSLGEYYSSNAQYSFLNFSSTIVALKETEKHPETTAIEPVLPPALEFFDLVSEGLFHYIDVRSKELSGLAFYDELTALPNKNFLKLKLKEVIGKSKLSNQKFALLFVGLNKFKDINDVVGHTNGDAILKIITNKLTSILNYNDTLMRFNGDEFIVLSENVNSTHDVVYTAQNILNQFFEPVKLDARQFYLSASIGVSQYPDNGDDVDGLIQGSYTAMHFLKKNEQNTFLLYEEEMQQRIIRRNTIENGLRRAIQNKEFEVYYQPKINSKTRYIVGAEALVRWNNSVEGVVHPTEFVSIAEENGLIEEIGDWVLKTACQQAKKWIDLYSIDFRIAVNLSARQLEKKDLTMNIIHMVDDIGLPPESLELEITESMIMNDLNKMQIYFKAFNSVGITLSLDDFGTGYSSLAYLKQLPVGHLKIDQSFIQDLTENLDDTAIISAIISMAHSLGITVIAEGVESFDQFQILKKLNCDEMQGHYFSRPIPESEFTRLLETQHKSKVCELY